MGGKQTLGVGTDWAWLVQSRGPVVKLDLHLNSLHGFNPVNLLWTHQPGCAGTIA